MQRIRVGDRGIRGYSDTGIRGYRGYKDTEDTGIQRIQG